MDSIMIMFVCRDRPEFSDVPLPSIYIKLINPYPGSGRLNTLARVKRRGGRVVQAERTEPHRSVMINGAIGEGFP